MKKNAFKVLNLALSVVFLYLLAILSDKLNHG